MKRERADRQTDPATDPPADGAEPLLAPFPYLGGKRAVAAQVWAAALGDPAHYIEPFAGSLAVLLQRPPSTRAKAETVNDASGMIVNIWRSIKHDPEGVLRATLGPVHEADYHARHRESVARREYSAERLRLDPRWHDAELAGWDVWGLSIQIGADWMRERPLGARPRSDARGAGITRFSEAEARLVLQALARRLARVDTLCGDWLRCCSSKSALRGPILDLKSGSVGVFLDPPYTPSALKGRECLYGAETTLAADVRAWCLEWGATSWLRVVLAGVEGEHDALIEAGWRVERWAAGGSFAQGGFSNTSGKRERRKEALWLSPHCLAPVNDAQAALFP
ncbi:MAG: DNA adenine methylase [Desulfurellales bacterium]|nr:MAG: DNA adenine methylase [Desulfurellales bacterium]